MNWSCTGLVFRTHTKNMTISTETIKARIAKWKSGPIPHINESIIKEYERNNQRERALAFKNIDPPEDFFSFSEEIVRRKGF